ncbi:MAG TPA: magnesium-translocating P-type ATPase [Blastocatellia bacterium]|nr:magnesium-translocating P-type ATPase [Blastocatellia bacterium]
MQIATRESPPKEQPHSGLTNQEARRLLDQIGPNEPAPARRSSPVIQILVLFANPLAIILIIASIVSAFVGEPLNAIIIIAMVVLSVAINFVQTYRSERAVTRLRQQVAPTATVMRDGNWVELPRREIVPGDLIRLEAGDLVPADCRLVSGKDLHVNQAALTGESLPAEKEAGETNSAAEPSVDARNLVFLGTSVVSGTATALVVATGPKTKFGDIAARLAARPPETEFDRGTRRFGFLIMRTVFFLVLFVLIVSIAFHRDMLESLLFAVALAVGLTPEFLPMITTVTLGKGAICMSRQKVIVKHLAAIQNFGSMDVLCSDKTGTLTSGDMVMYQHLDPFGDSSDRVLVLAYVNSLYGSSAGEPAAGQANGGAVRRGGANPLDAAVLKSKVSDVTGFEKVDVILFDFDRRRQSVIVQSGGERLLIAKGAPEGILSLCSAYEAGGRTHALDQDARAKCESTFAGLSADGYRVLAIAYKQVPALERYQTSDETELVMSGFVTFYDPPLADAHDSIEALRRDGVEIKIITGDNHLVAKHVCSQVGLDPGTVVVGEDLEQMTDSALGHVAENTTVFARVSPGQKNRIILALKHRGHVVGYLGDGINDAPSLHAADVGISVAGAADVARDAAEIILLEQSLKVLHNGIIEGRKAFGNVMKYLLMGTSSNFGNMFSMAGATLFLPFLPMLATQILLNNFLYDLSQITIPTDNVDPSFIIKPRRWNISLIRDFMIYIGPISSVYDFLTFFLLLKVFHATESLFQTGWFVESLATQTLVIFIIRTAGNPFRSRASVPLTITTLAVVAIACLLPLMPLAGPLHFTPLPALYYGLVAVMTLTYLVFVDMVKRWLMNRPAFERQMSG